MLETAIIVFREALEASLIISIVLAAAAGLPGRARYITTGIAAGLLGATALAAFANEIAQACAGVGQESLNATILLTACAMLIAHATWMTQHGAELSRDARATGAAIREGRKPAIALAIVVAAAVLREGSETVLFLFGIAHESGSSAAAASLPAMALGAAIGGTLAMACGAILYLGLARIPLKRLFSVTNTLILLLAAGMAAQAAGFLAQADLLPSLGRPLWNTTHILPETSILGRVLHALIGYVARPAPIQLVFYLGALALAALLARATRPALPAVAAFAALLAAPHPARADQQVREPIVTLGEWELELNGSQTWDRRDDVGGAQSHTVALGYSPTDYLRAEIEGELEAEPGQNLRLAARTLETTWQLAEPGEYWITPGIFAELSNGIGGPNSATYGLLAQTDTRGWGSHRTVHTLNLFLSQDFGPNQDGRAGAEFAWQSRLVLRPWLQPGIEIYSEIEDWRETGGLARAAWQAGPVIAGTIKPLPIGRLRYELGYLAAMGHEAAHDTLRWKIEYEVVF